MEISLIEKLLDSINKFALFSYGHSPRADLVQKYCKKIDEILILLKPLLDENCEILSQLPPDEQLNEEIEAFNAIINEAREIIESWNYMTSKIYFVLQIEAIIVKIHKFSLEICQLVNSLAPSTSTSAPVSFEKLKQIKQDKVSDYIKQATAQLAKKSIPIPEILETISSTLSLSSNLELFIESIALDKLKGKNNNSDLDQINPIVTLVDHLHETLIREKQPHSINDVPIPADFCCPLSLKLMFDPVIVSSGQTYERVFIKKWIEMGYNICPKTRHTLAHTNLIPNYTVKQLIANWCESNEIELPDPLKLLDSSFPQSLVYSNSSTSDNNTNNNNNNSTNGSYQDSNITKLPLESSVSALSLEKKEPNGQSSTELKQNGPNSVSSSDNSINNSSNNNLHELGNEDSNLVSTRVSTDSDASVESNRENRTEPGPSSEPGSEPSRPVPEIQPSRNQSIWRRQADRLIPRIVQSQSTSTPDLAAIENRVRALIEDLKSDSMDTQRAATSALRLLAKHNMENRIVIANCGAVSSLVGLLYSPDPCTQENAVTALLNLSINDNNKIAIASAEAIDPLIHVLQTGSPEARENSAATLFSLSVIEENKVRIGRSGAIGPLVELLGNGTPRGKKDAATALFNLSIFHENKARIVQAGAVKHLVDLMDPAAGMVDKAVAVLANLATIPEGRTAIGQADGIAVLVEVVELGSARGKENAAAALLHLCTNSSRFCSQVLQEGAVPPLVALSQSGTPRAREKAQALLSYFRNQRHGNARRG